MIIDSNGRSKPHFVWQPNYPLNIDHTPRVKSIRFGDGYEQRLEDGINNTLLNLDLSFDNKSIDEYTAILHFLIKRKGTEYFVFTMPSPYNTNKRFVCRSWNDSFISFNNNSIKTRFEEVPA
jgi:phage-related protein